MKRLSLILTIFLLGIVLVSCGKTARMTSHKGSNVSESAPPVEQERLHGEVEYHGYFVLVKPQKQIVGKGNQGVFVANRTVQLSDYYIGKYEVTYKLWKEVYTWATSHGYTFEEEESRKGSHGDERNTENDPVTKVNWSDCIVWCNAYTEKEKGIEQCVYVYSDTNEVIKSTADLNPSKVKYDQSKKGYRLPTEAEWEYAARLQGTVSANATKYGYDYLTNLDSFSGARGKDSNENNRVAWYSSNSDSKTHPVGEKDPNYAGLYDMSGNVWEWCYDGLVDNISTGTHTNPIGSASADNRVVRGGSWNNFANGCVVGCRNNWWFHIRLDLVGCRVACSQ